MFSVITVIPASLRLIWPFLCFFHRHYFSWVPDVIFVFTPFCYHLCYHCVFAVIICMCGSLLSSLCLLCVHLSHNHCHSCVFGVNNVLLAFLPLSYSFLSLWRHLCRSCVFAVLIVVSGFVLFPLSYWFYAPILYFAIILVILAIC